MSKIDLDYAYGQAQAKLSKQAQRHSVFSIIGGDLTGHYRKRLVWTVRYSRRYFKNTSVKVMVFKTMVWLDDIICVTNCSIKDHERELRKVLPKLRKDAGYRASEQKTEMLKREFNIARVHQKK